MQFNPVIFFKLRRLPVIFLERFKNNVVNPLISLKLLRSPYIVYIFYSTINYCNNFSKIGMIFCNNIITNFTLHSTTTARTFIKSHPSTNGLVEDITVMKEKGPVGDMPGIPSGNILIEEIQILKDTPNVLWVHRQMKVYHKF